MKSKYTDSWLIKKICGKKLTEDFSSKNEASDPLTSISLYSMNDRFMKPWFWSGSIYASVPLARRFTLASRDRPKSIFFVCGSMTIGVFIRLRTVKIFYFFFGCLTFLFIPAKLFEMVEDWSYLGFVFRLFIGQSILNTTF